MTLLQSRTSNNVLDGWIVLVTRKAYVPDGLNEYGGVAGIAYGDDLRGNLRSDGRA